MEPSLQNIILRKTHSKFPFDRFWTEGFQGMLAVHQNAWLAWQISPEQSVEHWTKSRGHVDDAWLKATLARVAEMSLSGPKATPHGLVAQSGIMLCLQLHLRCCSSSGVVPPSLQAPFSRNCLLLLQNYISCILLLKLCHTSISTTTHQNVKIVFLVFFSICVMFPCFW